MKRILPHIIVALFTFVLSVAGTSLFLVRRSSNIEGQKPLEAKETIAKVESQALESESSQLESLSPYDIESFINNNPQANVEEIWQGLGIGGEYNGESHYNAGKTFFTQCLGCEAEAYEYELDGESGMEVLLKISDRSQEACRYLIFKPTNESDNETWKLLGHIDHDFGRYRMPQHFYVLSGGESWLIVQVQEVSGSGVALYYDRLFKVNSRGIEEVLSYPSDGHQSGMSDESERDFSGRISSCSIKHGVAAVNVDFAVSYSLFDENNKRIPLWSKKQKAVYRINLSSKKVTLVADNSDLSEHEIDNVYNIDSLSNEDLLKYNMRELIKITDGKDVERKEWLQGFLKKCKRTQEKTALKQLLAK